MRTTTPDDEAAVAGFLQAHWGTRALAIDGVRIDAATLPGFLIEREAALVGLVTILDCYGFAEIVTLNVDTPRAGDGSRLLQAVVERCDRLFQSQIRLRTTNDNIDALRFCQRRGFRLVGLVPEARVLDRISDPSIAEIGRYGIPLRDEIVLMRQLA